MTLQAISKGFENYKNFGLDFSIKIIPLVFLFGFIASSGSTSQLAMGLSNIDIMLLLFNNFLISPFITIFSILLANDLFKKNKRDVLVYYAISWQFLIKVLSLTLISTFAIGMGLIFFVIPGILIAGLLIFVNYYAILENKSISESLYLSWERSKLNLAQCTLMATFFWLITIVSITILSSLIGNYDEPDDIPKILRILSSSIAIYIQICLISFPILAFYQNQLSNEIKDRA
tara:strand:- start:3903 stop:4598 length:696 start_codon:yes stop_codon:yes gene_type:complete